MRTLAKGLLLLVIFGVAAACGSDGKSGGAGSGGTGSGSGGTTSGTASTASCNANPEPGDTCSGSGTCPAVANCFCLSGSISCSDGPSPTSGGANGGSNGATPSTDSGAGVDCGNDPQDGDNCSGGPGTCDGSQRCYCNSRDEVRCN